MIDDSPKLPPITLTSSDSTRLSALIATKVGLAYPAEARRLRGELRRARLVQSYAVPPNLVTMSSKVIYADVDTRETKEVTIVYPWSARQPSAVSILSPVGTALLGLTAGDAIAWTLDDASVKRLRVLAVPYQPEAAGHWYL
jgi:regulator of nucleoside diphosphate kinase